MNEPVISVGILTGAKISFELYGEFTSGNSERKISGRFSAMLRDGKIVVLRDGVETFREGNNFHSE